MKTAAKHYGRVALLMAGIVLLGSGLTILCGQGMPASSDTCTVVTTTYPLYVAAENVLGDIPGVHLENLTGSATGCLHDYQLSPANRIQLERAKLVLLNGGGAEVFLEDVLPSLKAKVCNTGAGIGFLISTHEHHHNGGDDGDDGDDHDGDGDHDHEETAYNEHIWVSPTRYARQVRAVTAALIELLPEHAEELTAHGEAYAAAVEAVGDELKAAAATLPSKKCVIFHESLAYLADDLGLTVIAALNVGEESGVSAGDLATAQRAVEEDPTALLLYDDQYTVRYSALDRAVPASHAPALDTAVKGKGTARDWLDAMEKNVALLRGVTEK